MDYVVLFEIFDHDVEVGTALHQREENYRHGSETV
jgi:hypothetical protein